MSLSKQVTRKPKLINANPKIYGRTINCPVAYQMISIQCTNLNVPTHLKVNGIFQLSVLLLLYHANAVVEELGGETDIDDVDERDVLTWFSYIAIISDADCDPILFRTTASCVTLSCSTTFDRLSTCDFKLLIWLQNNVPYKHKAALGKTKKIKLHNQ